MRTYSSELKNSRADSTPLIANSVFLKNKGQYLQFRARSPPSSCVCRRAAGGLTSTRSQTCLVPFAWGAAGWSLGRSQCQNFCHFCQAGLYQEFLEHEEFWFMGFFLTGRSLAWAEHWARSQRTQPCGPRNFTCRASLSSLNTGRTNTRWCLHKGRGCNSLWTLKLCDKKEMFCCVLAWQDPRT